MRIFIKCGEIHNFKLGAKVFTWKSVGARELSGLTQLKGNWFELFCIGIHGFGYRWGMFGLVRAGS